MLLVVAVVAGCGEVTPSVPSVTSSPTEGAGDPAIPEGEITEAVAFRQQYGLRADSMFVRAVAIDPAAQAGLIEFGVPLLPYELADLLSRHWDPDLLAQVRGYGLLFPDDFAGAYINQRANGVVVAFKDRVDRHRVALSNLVPPGSAVEIRNVEWSLVDLQVFVDQLQSERAWFDSIGVTIHPGENILENAVDLRFKGPEDAAGVIEEHFGRPSWLKAAWTGAVPWVGPRADLTIEVTDSNGKPVSQLWCKPAPVDRSVALADEVVIGTDAAGICVLENLPVALYEVGLHKYVDNDHYDPEPMRTFRIALAPGGTSTKVVVPGP
jgi:hypothetical protein